LTDILHLNLWCNRRTWSHGSSENPSTVCTL